MEPIIGEELQTVLNNKFIFLHHDCMLCGCKERTPLGEITWKQLIFKYVVCNNCGLVYMDPVPDKESYIAFYKNDFWKVLTGKIENFEGNVRKDDKGAEASIAYHVATRIPRISKALSYLGPNPKILEIGCAYGASLAHLYKEFNIQPFAIEPSEDAVDMLGRNYPFIKLIGRSAEEMIDNHEYDGFFDLVIFSHSLENITAPIGVLQAVHRLLGDGKYLYVDTPDLFWSTSMNPYHPFIYSPDTLAKLLGVAGFKIERMDASPAPTSFLIDIFKKHKKHFYTIAQKSNQAINVPMESTGVNKIKKLYEISRKVFPITVKIKWYKKRLGLR